MLGVLKVMQALLTDQYFTGFEHYIDDSSNGYQAKTNYGNSNVAGSLRFIHISSNKPRWIAIVHEPNQSPWDWKYQTVGIMDNGNGGSSSSDGGIDSTRGGFSFGLVTAESDLPTANANVTFTGRAYGSYKEGNSNEYLTRADVEVMVNFSDGNRTATITTSNTRAAHSISEPGNGGGFSRDGNVKSFGNSTHSAPDTNLDFTGTLTYDDDYKWYRGDIAPTDSSSTLTTGDAAMRAYGPTAEEVGGVFKMQNSDGTKRYAGGFGAK